MKKHISKAYYRLNNKLAIKKKREEETGDTLFYVNFLFLEM